MHSVQTQLSSRFDARLVTELLQAFTEVKRNFFLGGLRLAEVEGGRFCEAAFRLLEQAMTNSFTPLGQQIDTQRLINRLQGLPSASYPASVRLHIPRVLRVIYDVRNQRDAAHLADGIDPNLQDATLVVSNVSWVLAEFVRLYHSVPADEAHRIVDSLVARQAPIIQDFNGTLKVLSPSLGASDHCLVLLYHRGELGASFKQLESWVRPKMRANLRRTLGTLCDEKDLVHYDGSTYFITHRGESEVEVRKLIMP